MEVLWFTKHFHVNVLYGCKHYSSILKMWKVRPRNINLLIITQFASKSSYSYFQSMEHLEKGCGEVTSWDLGKVGKFPSRTSSSVHQRQEPKGLQYPGGSKRGQEATKRAPSFLQMGFFQPAQLREQVLVKIRPLIPGCPPRKDKKEGRRPFVWLPVQLPPHDLLSLILFF